MHEQGGSGQQGTAGDGLQSGFVEAAFQTAPGEPAAAVYRVAPEGAQAGQQAGEAGGGQAEVAFGGHEVRQPEIAAGQGAGPGQGMGLGKGECGERVGQPQGGQAAHGQMEQMRGRRGSGYGACGPRHAGGEEATHGISGTVRPGAGREGLPRVDAEGRGNAQHSVSPVRTASSRARRQARAAA